VLRKVWEWCRISRFPWLERRITLYRDLKQLEDLIALLWKAFFHVPHQIDRHDDITTRILVTPQV